MAISYSLDACIKSGPDGQCDIQTIDEPSFDELNQSSQTSNQSTQTNSYNNIHTLSGILLILVLAIIILVAGWKYKNNLLVKKKKQP